MKRNGNFSELMGYAGKHRFLTYASWVLSALSALLALVPFVYIWLIVREVIRVNPDFSQASGIVKNGWMAVLFALLSMLVYFAALMCSHLSAFRIAGNIRKRAMAHVAALPLGFTEEMGSGRVRRIVNESSAATETYLAHQLPDLAGAIATPIGMLALLFAFDWRLGLLCLIPSVAAFCIMAKMTGKSMAEKMRQYQGALEDMNNEAVEYVRGIPVVKTFGQTVFSFKRFKGSIDRYNTWVVAYTKQLMKPMLWFTTAINGAFALLVAAGLVVARGGVTPEFLLDLIFYIIFTPVISVTLNKVMYMSKNGLIVDDAMRRIRSLLEIRPLPEPASPRLPKDNSVEFDEVRFRYRNASEDAVKGVSFRAEPGQTVAFVGPSGGGKTTAAGLISRFWDASGGAVKVGGENVRDIPKETLMRTVSYVFQDSKLLKASVRENVKLARPEATEREILTALHDAQCDDIVAKLPRGIDTVIGAKGVYLSGGERQRIAIARALLKNAPIVVLDEATAFADPENEAAVQRAFERLSEGRTVIMIAHRLTTVRHADRICVWQEGQIAESGTHEELLEQKGLYEKMWRDYQTTVSWKVGGES